MPKTDAPKTDWANITKLGLYVLITLCTGAVGMSWKLRGDISIQEQRVTHVEAEVMTNKDAITHMVPREEHEARWQDTSRRLDDIMKRLEDVRGDIRDVRKDIKDK